MAWQPIYRSSGKPVNRILNDQEKEEWENHPISRGLFRFKEVNIAPPPKIEIPEPVEAKRFEKPPLIEIKEIPIEPKRKQPQKRGRKK